MASESGVRDLNGKAARGSAARRNGHAGLRQRKCCSAGRTFLNRWTAALNPLGARALYLFQGNKDTLFRIHGTNEPDTIGKAVSSGCIRMMNADVIDLYQRVGVGTRVVVE
ncbi:protein of unknown function [Methylocella tundrae]|uniref:L,D-TPase catalytic domain-containing protein n=1 Tax=Methylocella tundrae TaxID=227605 RepID=A0A4U8Z675_METTU|nr:protein of unknown function [Methylocella tundrae]